MYSEGYYKRKYPILFSKFKNHKTIYCRELRPFYFIYDDVVIRSLDPSHVISLNPEKRASAETLIDLLAYFFYMPSFIDTSNGRLNQQLAELYGSFDLFFNGVVNNLKNKDEIVHIGTINHPILLAFYNTALKQPEPLAKCVFLFRIVEYYNSNISPHRVRLQDCIEPLYNQAINHQFIPLDLIPPFNKIKKFYPNQIVRWKKKSKEIHNKWNSAGLVLGDEVYKRARCGSAHGSNTCSIIMHDYAQDYKFVSEVNVFLELMCRYIIESQNPHFIENFKLNYRNNEFGYYEKKPRIMVIHDLTV